MIVDSRSLCFAGTITLDPAGNYTLALKPQSLTGPVMDLRQIILLPVLN